MPYRRRPTPSSARAELAKLLRRQQQLDADARNLDLRWDLRSSARRASADLTLRIAQLEVLLGVDEEAA